ncbi:MAG: PIN domain-containing protein [Candidatus Omnitrophota bacterium]
MTIWVLRIFFALICAVSGYYIGSDFSGLPGRMALTGAFAGLGISFMIMIVEARLKSVSLRNLSAAAFGLVFGFFMARMMILIANLIPMEPELYPILQISFTLIFCYLGVIIAIKGKDEFNVIIPYIRFSRQDQRDQRYILDTSVIIDGRISAISETGFIEGKLIVPRFILHELQQVADSSDDEKRNRGRKGLDMLERLKTVKNVEVVIHEERLSGIREVDAKLVRLGKLLEAPLVTNDFNLNKVAKLEGVKVLNINDLAGAMRPLVFPGESMMVYVKKEGKERNQGVAFMDDGTMIVIDNARRYIGRTVNATVSSVLQTAAGRMIFADLNEKAEQKPENRNERNSSRDAKRPGQNGNKAPAPGENTSQPEIDRDETPPVQR